MLACPLLLHSVTLYNGIHLISVGPVTGDIYTNVIKAGNQQQKYKPKPPVKPRSMYESVLQTYRNSLNLNII